MLPIFFSPTKSSSLSPWIWDRARGAGASSGGRPGRGWAAAGRAAEGDEAGSSWWLWVGFFPLFLLLKFPLLEIPKIDLLVEWKFFPWAIHAIIPWNFIAFKVCSNKNLTLGHIELIPLYKLLGEEVAWWTMSYRDGTYKFSVLV